MTNFLNVARRVFLTTAMASAMTLSLSAAHAGNWPSGSVQLIVPAKPGGGTDAAARVIAAALGEKTGGNFVVVNNPGGGGAIAAEQVRSAAPDGTTLLFFHTGILSSYHTGGYDHSPIEEFAIAIAMPVAGSYSLAVPADSPYQTMADLVQATKDNPEKITLGVQLRGSSHFMAGLIAMSSGSQFRVVEAGSDADKLVQLQGNQINAALVNTPGALQYVQKGDLRVLATIAGTPDRDKNAPDLPSMAELGYADAVYGLDFLILGPKGMDAADVEAVNAAFTAVLADDEITAQLAKMRMPISAMSVADSQTRLKSSDKRVKATAQLLGLAK